VSQIQTITRLVKAKEREVLKLRKDIYDGLDRAFMKFENQPTDENSERVNDAINDVLKYNIKYNQWEIKDEDINKSLEGRAKSRALACNGLVINPNLMGYLADILPECGG
jgi:Ser-tRNA(Ala) deacylase AlaX